MIIGKLVFILDMIMDNLELSDIELCFSECFDLFGIVNGNAPPFTNP